MEEQRLKIYEFLTVKELVSKIAKLSWAERANLKEVDVKEEFTYRVHLSKVSIEASEVPLSLCKRVNLIYDGMNDQSELFMNFLDYYDRWVKLELRTKHCHVLPEFPCQIHSIDMLNYQNQNEAGVQKLLKSSALFELRTTSWKLPKLENLQFLRVYTSELYNCFNTLDLFPELKKIKVITNKSEI